jgi:hypothetical protein
MFRPSGNGLQMTLDVHERVSATQRAVERARGYAIETVEAAQAIDLHEPAHAVKRSAKRATKRAGAAASRAAGRESKRAGRRVVRTTWICVAAGIVAVVAVVVARRTRFTRSSVFTDEPPESVDRAATSTETPDEMREPSRHSRLPRSSSGMDEAEARAPGSQESRPALP